MSFRTTTQTYLSALYICCLLSLSLIANAQTMPGAVPFTTATGVKSLAIPRYTNGDVTAGGTAGTAPGFVIFNQTYTGTTAPDNTFQAQYMGATWGVAYKTQNRMLYVASVLRRHNSFGPNGVGAIYQINTTNLAANPVLFMDLKNSYGIDCGTSPRVTDGTPATVNSANELPSGKDTPNWDQNAYALIGKTGLGGIDVSADGNRMYVMNLYKRELVVIDISTASPFIVGSYALPTPVGMAGGVLRPWAVKCHNGRVLVGAVSDGTVSNNLNDVKSYIFEFVRGAFNAMPIVTVPMNYTRGFIGNEQNAPATPLPNPNNIKKWNTWDYTYKSYWNTGLIYPQPILSDIEIDTDGSLILGFMDRAGMQGGVANYRPNYPTAIADEQTQTGGDLLRICNVGGAYITESASACQGNHPYNNLNGEGPGGNEFYWGDMDSFNPYNAAGGYHHETTQGGLAFNAGSNEVATTAMNPINNLNAGGVAWFSNTGAGSSPPAVALGGRSRNPATVNSSGYQIYNDSGLGTPSFAKAAGLGDIELFGNTTFGTVGNFVWNDVNNNGLQDDGPKSGMSGVKVELYKSIDATVGNADDVLVNTAYTYKNAGMDGYYLFVITESANYYVKFPTTAAGVGGLTTANNTLNTNDNNSDANTTTGNTHLFAINIAGTGTAKDNLTLDAGYYGPCTVSMTQTIGNCIAGTNRYTITGTITFTNPPLDSLMGFDGYGDYTVIYPPYSSPYNFTITNAIADGAVHNLVGGFYGSTCDTAPFTYTAPAAPNIAIAGIKTITEGATTTLTASGGNTYLWENGSTSALRTVSPIVTTSYTVSVTNTINNCMIPKTVNITVNPKYICAATTTQINGIVFQDINYNGTQDGVSEIGVAGATVRAYNTAGTLVATRTTTANGTYTISSLTANARYRIEFELPTALAWARPTQNNGTTNGTTVQFITAGSCAILGVANPDDYCQTDPKAATTLMKFGAATAAVADAVVSIPTSNPINAWADTLNQATIISIAKANPIGSTYGLAYKKDTKQLFASAYIRRHAGIGTGGTGAIYKLDPTGIASPTLFVDLNAIFGAGTTIADPHPYGTTATCPNGGTPSNFSCWFNDIGAYNAVGRQGLADMDISEDGKFLYVMNMTDKTLYRIEIANPTISGITKFPFPVNLPTATKTSATTNQIRPFGLGINKGRVFAAAVNTEEDLNPTGGLWGGDYSYIYALDPNTATWTLVFEGSLQPYDGRMLQWPTTFRDAYNDNGNKIIADIDFDTKGNMIMGIRDISADKFSELAGKPIAGDNAFTFSSAAGNIVKAGFNTITNKYELENDGVVNGLTSTAGRNGFGFPVTLAGAREFFHGDATTITGTHYETVIGSVAYAPVRDEVFCTMYDILDVYTQGIVGFSNVTGERDGSYEITKDTRPLYFGKANGMGDLEMLCNAAPLEIGNYVWADTDADGVQDADEYGIPNVQVRLYSRTGVLVGLTNTNNAGEYYFNLNNVDTTGVNVNTGVANTAFTGMSQNTPYYIVVAQAGGSIFNTTNNLLSANGNSYTITTANATTGAGTTPDLTDNDAVIATSINAAFNSFPYIRAVTGLAGGSDHSFDFGFKPMPTVNISASIGNCYDNNGATAGGTSQIDVKVTVEWANAPASNNITVTVPNGGTQTVNTTTATSPLTLTFAVPTVSATSGNITASFTPTTSVAATPIPLNIAASNCIQTPCIAGAVGGTVWIDSNNNGIQEPNETPPFLGAGGVGSVTVKAYNSANALVATTTTDYLGQYVFAGLVPTVAAPIRIEFTNIPANYLLAEAGADNQGAIQFINTTTCTANMAVFPTACGNITYPTWLKKGYSVVSFLPDAGNVVLAVKDMTKMGTLWDDPSSRNNNQGAAVPTIQTWTRAQFGNNKVYGITIDQRNGTIYVATSGMVGDQTHAGGYIFDSLVPARIYKISNLSATPVLWATTPGSLGIGGIDIDTIHNQVFVSDIDNGKIYSFNTITASQTSVYDPLLPDNGSTMRPPVLGDAVLGLGYNTVENKLYYSVWANNTKWNGTSYTRASANNNTIRSIKLNTAGQFVTATDQLEMTLPFITTPTSVNNYSEPVADIEFSADGKKVLLAETAITEDAATPARYSVAAHTTRVLEYQISGSTWTLQPTIAGNLNSKYDLGASSAAQYSGLNSRGGASWAYKKLTNGQITGNEDFVVMTGDALHLQSYDGDFIYGYQFTPSTGGNRENSVLANFGLPTGGKYTYGDVEILKGVPSCVAGIEIGNYVWRDLDSDGIQDANEPPIAGVDVLLKLGTTLVAKTKTNATGNYYFGGATNEGFTFESTTTSAQSITVPIPNTSNDARQNATTVINGAAGLLFNERTLGLRFPNIAIPKGATITNANIRFTASAAGTISSAVIKGVKNPDQATFTLGTLPFTGSLSDLFTNNATTANATWNVPTTWVVNASGADQTTPNLTAIVSEIVAMPTWERNKALAFVIEAPINATGAVAYDYTGDPAKAAVLSISFTGTTGTTGDSLKTNTTYTIEIPLAQTPITTNSLVPTVADSDASANGDSRDSDGTISGTNLIKVLTTPIRGANHTYDFGFTVCPLNNCGTVIYNKN
jgi:SdrD B-like domain